MECADSPPLFRDLTVLEPDGYDSALEEVLCQAPFFREKGLRLYRGIDPAQIQPSDRSLSKPDGEYQRAYLLCRGQKVLLTFRVLQRGQQLDRPPSSLKGTLTLAFLRGQEASAPPALQRAVGLMLGQDKPLLWEYSPEPVDAALWPHLVREGLVTRRYCGSALRWEVSPAGQEQGLCWGWRMDGGKLRQGPLWSPKTRRKLETAWRHGPKPYPLTHRLQALETGRSLNNNYARQVVEQFAQTTLGNYMTLYPQELEELETVLGVGPETPYHQAAALIWKRLQSPDDADYTEGVRLMHFLAFPLLNQEVQM